MNQGTDCLWLWTYADHRAGLALHLGRGLVGGVRFGGAQVGDGPPGAVFERAAPAAPLHVDVPLVSASAAPRAQVCSRQRQGVRGPAPERN